MYDVARNESSTCSSNCSRCAPIPVFAVE
jgi:hypothetical protein